MKHALAAPFAKVVASYTKGKLVFLDSAGSLVRERSVGAGLLTWFSEDIVANAIAINYMTDTVFGVCSISHLQFDFLFWCGKIGKRFINLLKKQTNFVCECSRFFLSSLLCDHIILRLFWRGKDILELSLNSIIKF